MAAGLGELFISKAMSERLQAAHFELTGKPLTGKLAVPVAELSELVAATPMPSSSGTQQCVAGQAADSPLPPARIAVQIWLRASGWEPLDECRRAVAAARTMKQRHLTTVARTERLMAALQVAAESAAGSAATTAAAASGPAHSGGSKSRIAAAPVAAGPEQSQVWLPCGVSELGSAAMRTTAVAGQRAMLMQCGSFSPDSPHATAATTAAAAAGDRTRIGRSLSAELTVESVQAACAEQGAAD